MKSNREKSDSETHQKREQKAKTSNKTFITFLPPSPSRKFPTSSV